MRDANDVKTKSGFVTIVGRPNVGKSTLLNGLLGKKVSITSPKPQTTRCQILGIKSAAHFQIVYIDTPGMHTLEKKAMNRYLNRVAGGMLLDADVIIFVVDYSRWTKDDELVIKKFKEKHIVKPVILVLNKIDLLEDKSKLLPLMAQLKEKYDFKDILPLSAKQCDYVEELQDIIVSYLPQQEFFYEAAQFTDKSINFQVAEIIREKLILQVEEELPYVTALEIEQLVVKESIVEISALIWVERRGQKTIIIGKGGLRLKTIGKLARNELEQLFGKQVFLRLWVKVRENWTDDEAALRNLGYE